MFIRRGVSMKVNKNTIIKTAFECGLKPIESTWKVTRENYYDKYHGSETYTQYELSFENEIKLSGNKYTGDEPSFMLYVSRKQDMVNADVFVNELNIKGYIVDINIATSWELKNTLEKEIKTLRFNEDIQKVLNFIKTLNEVHNE